MSAYSIQHSIDFVLRYRDLLLQKLRKPRNEAFLAAIIEEAQELEDAVIGVITGVDIDTAVGAGLDLVGKILRVPRAGMSDDDYRLRLKVEILILHSHGTPDDLCAIVTIAHGPDFRYTEYDYATTWIELRGAETAARARQILGFLKRAKALGTRILLQYTANPDRTFTFSVDADVYDTSTTGLGDYPDPSVGGWWSSVIT